MNAEVIETVLTEILEEQKQINQKLDSFISILIEMHEKIDNPILEKKESAFNKLNEHLRSVQETFQNISEQLTFPTKEINQLKISLDACTAQLRQPVKQQIKYQISKIWLITTVLFMAANIMIYFLWETNRKLKQYKINDYKYRHLKLSNKMALQKILLHADSLYIANPDSFKIRVQLRETKK